MHALTLLVSEKQSLKMCIFVIKAEVTEISEGTLNIVFDSGGFGVKNVDNCCLKCFHMLEHN